MVTASSALDVLSHAIESYTAIPFASRPAPERPGLRPAYQGANPISDIWSAKAMEMVAANLEQVVNYPDDLDARGQMMLAAAYAGIGFGNAGVHLPARHVLPSLGPGSLFCARGIPGRPCHRAARHVGDPECPGRLPLHRAGQIRSVTSRRRACWEPISGKSDPTTPARCFPPSSSTSCAALACPMACSAVGFTDSRHRSARGRYAPATPGHEALAPSRIGSRSCCHVPRRHGLLVVEGEIR